MVCLFVQCICFCVIYVRWLISLLITDHHCVLELVGPRFQSDPRYYRIQVHKRGPLAERGRSWTRIERATCHRIKNVLRNIGDIGPGVFSAEHVHTRVWAPLRLVQYAAAMRSFIQLPLIATDLWDRMQHVAGDSSTCSNVRAHYTAECNSNIALLVRHDNWPF